MSKYGYFEVFQRVPSTSRCLNTDISKCFRGSLRLGDNESRLYFKILQDHYTWLFYVGSLPIFIAFFGVSCLTHYESWDPMLLLVKKILHCLCSRRVIPVAR